MALADRFAPRGVVLRAGDGVAFVAGLDRVRFEEMLTFDSGAFGLAYDLRVDGVGVILLAGANAVHEGDGVVTSDRLPELPVGMQTLGRVLDPLGNPLDEGPPLSRQERLPLFRPAPEIRERCNVTRTLWTGVTAIDAAIPIGRGQRELIIGDRNVGKTALALDAVVAQQPGDVACVYVVIGQPMSRVLAIRETLARAGRLSNTVIIAAEASTSPGMQYLAPYAGASVAEWFRDRGQHALVVYVDSARFERDLRPAIDIGRCVSRIGAVAQPKPLREAARNLRIRLSRFESLEKLTRVGLDIDVATQTTLKEGNLIRALLRQGRLAPRGIAEQVIALTAVTEEWLKDVEPPQAMPFVNTLVNLVGRAHPDLVAKLNAGELPDGKWKPMVAALLPQAHLLIPDIGS